MAKGSGGTRGAKNSGSTIANKSQIGGGSGVLKGDSFDNMKLSDFQGQSFVSGASYTVSTKSGKYQMDVDLSNGYNSEYQTDGTTISISMRKTGDYRSEENIYNTFVEGTSSRTSGGVDVYRNYKEDSAKVLNNVMPYVKDLARNYIKRNK